MNDWTPEMVEERLVEAASVLRRLPAPRKQGYFSTWPTMFVEFGDLVGQTPEPMRPPPPSAAAISRMEATLGWMPWLEPLDPRSCGCGHPASAGRTSAGKSAWHGPRRTSTGSTRSASSRGG